MTMTRHYRSYAMRLVLAFAAALGVASFCALGVWQYGRGVEKRALLEQQRHASESAVPMPLQEAVERDLQVVSRVAGNVQYLPPLLLLDGQSREGRIGLRAYAVARPTPEQGVLVDLGWLPMPSDRSLPDVKIPTALHAEGLLAPWPGQGLRAAENPWPAQGSAVLLTYLDRAEIERHVGFPLATQVLRLDPAQPYGFLRDRQLLPNTLPPERHFGYAVQWFALAATVAVVWLVLTWRSLRKGKR
jgi:surfeit locus 1 family protein